MRTREQLEQIEGLRRSAAMSALPQSQVDELIATAAELARRQREIAKVLHTFVGGKQRYTAA